MATCVPIPDSRARVRRAARWSALILLVALAAPGAGSDAGVDPQETSESSPQPNPPPQPSPPGQQTPPAQQTPPGPPPEADELPPLAVPQLEGEAIPAPSEEPRRRPGAPDEPPGEAQQPSAGAVPPLAVAQVGSGTERLDVLDGPRRISLRFGEPLPITELLLFLFRDTAFSVVPDPGVEGRFIGELKDVTLRQALELVLHPLGLDYALRDESIRVFERRVETRMYPIDHVTTRRTGRRVTPNLRGSGAVSDGSDERDDPPLVVGVDAGDVFDEIAAGLETLLSERGRYNLDRKAALLQITDLPEHLDRVTAYLDAVSARINRQVLLQAEVIEVALAREHADGIDWSAVRASGADPAFAHRRPDGLLVGVPRRSTESLLAALAEQGHVNVLSRPRVVTLNNEPAVIHVGTVAMLDTMTEGLTLSVTPQVSLDGVISMSVSPRLTEFAGEFVSPDGDVVPILNVREADTVVRVFEGETVVVTGLMRDRLIKTRGKVPVIGSIPLLGRLFRRDELVESKADLVILLTPTVVPPGRVSDAMVRH